MRWVPQLILLFATAVVMGQQSEEAGAQHLAVVSAVLAAKTPPAARLQGHKTEHAVITCGDGRCIAVVTEWQRKHLPRKPDYIVEPGGANMVLQELYLPGTMATLRLYVTHHGVKHFHLFDHEDCGAYGGSSKHADRAAECAFHQKEEEKAVARLQKEFSQVSLTTYFVNLTEEDPVHQVQLLKHYPPRAPATTNDR